jgi:hypothetical protein
MYDDTDVALLTVIIRFILILYSEIIFIHFCHRMDSLIASDDEVDSIEVDCVPSFSSASTYRNLWIRPNPNMSQFTLENEGM